LESQTRNEFFVLWK
jgi:hypothetical protein